MVSNIYSSATSQVATLTVLIPPGISAPPHDTAVIVGSNAPQRHRIRQLPISYVWNKDGKTLSNGGRISGANSDSLNIAAAKQMTTAVTAS